VRFKGAFRAVRRADHAVPARIPRAATVPGVLEIRVWRGAGTETLLLASASRKQGPAAARNRFRRRVRHAFLTLMVEGAGPAAPTVVWVRPLRGQRQLGRIPFSEILEQLRLALNPPGGP
jgi:ribonuclease P protein component